MPTIIQDLKAKHDECDALKAEVQKLRAAGCSVLSHVGLTDAELKGLANKGPAASTATGTAPAGTVTPAAPAGKGKVSVKCQLARARRDELNREHDAIEGIDRRHTAKLQAAFREKNRLEMGLL